MTAFDNIKVNNWPAESNESEDFTIAKVYWDEPNFAMPTKVIDTILHNQPLTATGVITSNSDIYAAHKNWLSEGSTAGSTWDTTDYAPDNLFSGGDQAAITSTRSVFASNAGSWTYTFAGNGLPVNSSVEVFHYRNGGTLYINHGETDVQSDTSTSGFGSFKVTAAQVSVLKNIKLENSGNTGPYVTGIKLDGKLLVSNSFNVQSYASFTGSSSLFASFPSGVQLPGQSDWTIDLYMNKHPANGGDWSAPFGNWAAAGSNAQVSFGINGRTTASYDLYFGIDGGTYQNVVPGGDWNATRWCHYRYQYVHSTRAFTAWVNGDVKGTATVNSPGIKYGSSINTFDIGHQGDNNNAISAEFGPMRIVSKALGAPPSGGMVLNSRGRFNND